MTTVTLTTDFFPDGLEVAPPQGLMAVKLKIILQRAEAKDYFDIAALIDSWQDFAAGLAAARVLYGASFQPSESLKPSLFTQRAVLETRHLRSGAH